MHSIQSRLLAAAAVAFMSATALTPASAQMTSTAGQMADPTTKADPDMAKVLAALKALGPKPIETLEPGEARKQPSATDAVMKVIRTKSWT
jgi:hypothetical protein